MATPSFFFKDNSGTICEWKVYAVTPTSVHLVFWRRQPQRIDVYAGFSNVFDEDGSPIAWGVFHSKHSHTSFVLDGSTWKCVYKRTLKKQKVLRNAKCYIAA